MRFFVVILACGLLSWDSKIHTGIIHASLMSIPAEDHIEDRLGDEVWRLGQYVQMGDWVNTFVSGREDWDTGGQTLELASAQFFANDYLLFPAMPRTVNHMVPDVKATYRPFFLRALQALRMESPANAARWMGSLLHFVTDSGSPPHTIGVKGPDHTKMESWLDPWRIDLSQYHAQMLGNDDESAAEGLAKRVDGLIAYSAIRAKQLLPLVKVDDRAKMEPIALESAAETARVAADVIHTLLKLSEGSGGGGGTLAATVSAPEMDGMENLPAKLMLLNTQYSTLSERSGPGFHLYRGTLVLRHLPPGNYSLAVERIGCETLFIPALIVKAGVTATAAFKMQPSRVAGNLAPNADLRLHWITPDAPDHWHFDAARQQWLSDNIPVAAGVSYRVGWEAKEGGTVELQWMSHAWQAMKAPAVPLEAGVPVTLESPREALFVRFVVKGNDARSVVRSVFVSPGARGSVTLAKSTQLFLSRDR